jgi:hypothetical protein
MFIKIESTYYFINIKNKSTQQIYQEIFGRMNKQFLTSEEIRKIHYEIRKQINEKI